MSIDNTILFTANLTHFWSVLVQHTPSAFAHPDIEKVVRFLLHSFKNCLFVSFIPDSLFSLALRAVLILLFILFKSVWVLFISSSLSFVTERIGLGIRSCFYTLSAANLLTLLSRGKYNATMYASNHVFEYIDFGLGWQV